MSDEEYDDELPPISVNSSFRESSGLHMPSAEELASQRAREAECERELQLLRAADEDPAPTTDSSGSEGEAALAAAVTRLQMRGAMRARPPALAELLPAMLRALPEADALLPLLDSADACEAVVDATCGAVWCGGSGAALCAAVLCAGGVGARRRDARRRCRRGLLRVLATPPLDDPDSEECVKLMSCLLSAAGCGLELADALAPARASASAARLHRRLLVAALAELLDCDAFVDDSECLCSWSWRAVCQSRGRAAAAGAGAGARAAGAVRACGRLARACAGSDCGPHRDKLLQALAAPVGNARAQPDRLEVLVGASKLQLLFRE